MAERKVSLNHNDVNEIKAIVSPILGKSAWDASLGFGSFITVEFGLPIKPTENAKYLRGEWHLWVKHAFWRLEENNRVLVGSEDDRKTLGEKLKAINGLNLEVFDINPVTYETVFLFGGRVKLSVIPTSYLQNEYEYWTLYTPQRKVLLAGPGMEFRYEDSSNDLNRNASS